VSDYQTLQNIAVDWMNRTDLTGQAEEFVRIAEARIARDVSVAYQRVKGDWTLTDQETLVPADWISFISVPLQYMPPHRMFEAIIYGDTGEATSYTMDGRYLVVAPFSGSQALSVRYKARLPRLVNGNDTNSLLTDNPDLYLHAVRAARASIRPLCKV
jgi:hypothetical protein